MISRDVSVIKDYYCKLPTSILNQHSYCIMIRNLFPKLYRLPSTLRQKIYPSVNRLLFSCMSIRFGKNMNVLGRISVVCGGG